MWPECATDSDGLALLRAAVANPREETPRWVLADWLQERGEEQVAEALREPLRVHGQVPLPAGVRARWSPWQECVDGWLGVLHPTLAELSALCADPPAIAPWITGLGLGSMEVTDAGAKELAALKHLTTLDLSDALVTDAGVTELAVLTSLTTLNLFNTGVTDAGVTALTALKHLTTLDLSDTQVTDAGAKELAALTNLTTLHLGATGLTDAGVKELATLTKLTSLNLGRTEVTDAGVAELQQALPKCKISK